MNASYLKLSLQPLDSVDLAKDSKNHIRFTKIIEKP